MKNVVIFYGGFLSGSGGAFFHAKNAEHALIENGWNVEIITLDNLPFIVRFLPHLVEKLINLFFRPIGYLYKAYTTKFLYKLLFAKKFNLIIFEDIYISWDSMTPSLTILHAVWSDNLQSYNVSKKLEKTLKKAEVKIINKIKHNLITVSEPYKNYILCNHYNETINKTIDVVELGIDQSQFKNTSLNVKRKKSLIYAGALEERKNILFLLEVFKKLYEIDSDYSLTIIGWGKNRSKYEEFVAKNNLSVSFLGRLSHAQVVRELSKHELYIHTSVKESFSYALLEAKLSGLKTIANLNLQVPCEFIDIGFEGFDVSDWSNGIINNQINLKIFDGSKYTSKFMMHRTLDLLKDL